MYERLYQMLIKEFIQLRRDPMMLRMIFVAPLIQLFVFGYAATTDIRHVATALLDRDRSVASRELTARFSGSGYFRIQYVVGSDAEARQLLDRGDVQVVLDLPGDFERNLQFGRTADLQLLVDGTNANTAGLILAYANRIVQRYADEWLDRRLARSGSDRQVPGRVDLRVRPWFNENLESRNFYVPGVIANITMLITLMLTSMAIVREKEIGTMEQLIATPISPREFILGKTLPFGIIGVVDTLLILGAGVFWFEVPIRGSILLLLGCALLFLYCCLSLGLLISTLCHTQQQAMMITFFFFFPAIMLSGFIYPIANMPAVVQAFTWFDPLRYFLVVIRGIFLKGLGFAELWPQFLALALLGSFFFWLAVNRFHKTIS